VTGGGGSVLSTLIAPNSNSNTTFPSFGNSIGGGFGFDDVATTADGDMADESIGDDLPEITAEAAVPFRATYCEIEGRRHAIVILKNTPPVAKEEITFSCHRAKSTVFPFSNLGSFTSLIVTFGSVTNGVTVLGAPAFGTLAREREQRGAAASWLIAECAWRWS